MMNMSLYALEVRKALDFLTCAKTQKQKIQGKIQLPHSSHHRLLSFIAGPWGIVRLTITKIST